MKTTPSSPTRTRTEQSFRGLLTVASLVVVVAGLRAAESILVPFLVALFLTVLSLPLYRGLWRRRVPTGVAAVVTLVVIAAVLALLGYMLSLSVTRVTAKAPQYQERFQEHLQAALEWLQAHGIDAAAWVAPESMGPGPLVDLVTGTFLGVANLLTGVFLVLLITTFLLLETRGFEAKLERALGQRRETLRRYAKIRGDIQRYVVIKTLVSLATGWTVGLWVWAVGLDFALLWGFVAFLLNYIPNIGSILAAIPAVGLAFVQLGAGRALLVLVGYAVVNLALGNLLEPHLLGRRLRLSSLAVLLSLVFWGWVWGPLGMLLSVPITMALKIVMENSERLQWLAVLLEQAPRDPRAGPEAPRRRDTAS